MTQESAIRPRANRQDLAWYIHALGLVGLTGTFVYFCAFWWVVGGLIARHLP